MKYIPLHALSMQYFSSFLSAPQFFVDYIGGFKAGHARWAYQQTTYKLTAVFGKDIPSEKQDPFTYTTNQMKQETTWIWVWGGMNMPTYKRYSSLSVICEILYKHNFGLLL